MAKEKLTCSICFLPIGPQANGWAGGHNAEPINDGRCCERCDQMVVIPARINIYRQQKAKE